MRSTCRAGRGSVERMIAPPPLVAYLADNDPALSALPFAHRALVLRSVEAGAAAPAAVVVGAPVALRAAPSASAPVVAVLPCGARVELERAAAENGYCCARAGDATGFASVLALAPLAPAPVLSEVPAGEYVVRASAPLRVQPSIDADSRSSLAPGERVRALGDVANAFAHVETIDRELNDHGWASVAALEPARPAESTTIATPADNLALRAMLAAWANATPGAPAYGAPSDYEDTPAATERARAVVAAFQQSQNLPATGDADAVTRDRLIAWSQDRAAELAAATVGPALVTVAPSAPTAPAPSAPGPVTTPRQAPAPDGSTLAKYGPVLAVAGVALVAWFVLEERRKARVST